MSNFGEKTGRPLAEQIREVALSGDISLPPLPQVGMRVLTLLQDHDRVDVEALSETIQTDPAIAASILRMANSAYYGGLQPVSDPQQAISRLGLNQVGSVVTTLVHRGQFESKDKFKSILLQSLWDHAVSSALAARHLAQLAGSNGEESYLAGLFHDIGKLLVLKAIDHLASTQPDFGMMPIIMDEIIDVAHADLGQKILTEWGMPEPICLAVGSHHDAADSIEDFLSLRVQAGNAISKKIGAHPRPEPDLLLEEVPAVELLNLTDVELAALTVDLEDELAGLKDLL